MNTPYTVSQLESLLRPIFMRNGVRRATLFGSYAKGSASPSSDVDLMVESGLRGLAFFGLLEDVYQRLGCDVDLIDSTQIVPDSRVAREIRSTGVVIYEQ